MLGSCSCNCYKALPFGSLLAGCIVPCACHAKRHLNFQKRFEPHQFFFPLFTSTCASRHDSAHFFHISTSKSAPRQSVFNTSDLETCFVPQDKGVLFFDISTSRRDPNVVRFVKFDFNMCFTSHWRASFHLSSNPMAPHPPL